MILLHNHEDFVFIDSGSTHSFISSYFARKLGVVPTRLGKNLGVGTVVRDNLIVDSVIRGCSILVVGYEFKPDVVLLPFEEFDIILGMVVQKPSQFEVPQEGD